ncbi:MAG: hypothetical protein B7Y02_12045 [Rhodobacterales bacterium 17-64-5]|nr:MAG: hypothetical protein B7Y02_12045 [Rhodobacterales bacterium 17-64-5]
MTAAAPALAESQLQVYASFASVIELIRQKRDMVLLNDVESGVRLVRYAPGRIEFEPGPHARPDLAARLGQQLQAWTGVRWGVSVVGNGGAPTLAETRLAERAEIDAKASESPLMQAILAAFPGARITDVRSPEALLAAAEMTALPLAESDADDDWNPFEE